MRILICEDDTMTLKALEHRLGKENYEIVTAADGKAAYDVLNNEQIDFMLTDLHMPHLNGLELIEYVRNQLKLNIPIVMLTRVGVEDTVLKAFELGADDYITKPFSPDELSLRIKKAILKVGK
ncbi:MAG: response regulator transcription factor [Bacteroidota bacterium]